MATTNPFAGHALRNPAVDAATAREIAFDVFGAEGEVTELASHQDRNFLVGARWVLKVANPAFAREELELQNAAMEHVAPRVEFAVPRPIGSRVGTKIVRAAGHDVRLVTFVPGTPLQSFPYFAPVVLRRVGTLAGETAAALADFEHPAATRALQWDLQHAADVVEAIGAQLDDGARRAAASRAMEAASRELEPLARDLPRQVIHGDICDWNVIAERDEDGRARLVGLIDFGDVVRSYRVAELAVAATSCVAHATDTPLQAVCEVAAAFHARLPLTEPELAAVWPLVVARAASVAVSTEQQAQLERDNAYVVESAAYEWSTLDLVAAIPAALAGAAVRAACRLEPSTRAFPPLARMLDLPAGVGIRDQSVTSDDDGGAIGRWGEARLADSGAESEREPATVHLGADAHVAPGTPVIAPATAVVVRTAPDLLLKLGGGYVRVTGVDADVAAGACVEQGQRLGSARGALHLQLMHVPDAPSRAPASLRDAWLALCPDPSALLGVDAAAPPPRRDAVLAEREAHVARPQAYYYERPPEIERGRGYFLYDEHARPYVDMVNNVAILGHSHPAVERAAARQLRLLNTNSRFLYDAMPRFAARLAALVPDPLEVVFFVSSGSEANDLALRLARAATGVQDVLCVEGNYHGWTTATYEVSTSHLDNPNASDTRPPWIHTTLSPNTYRGAYRGPDAAERYADDARHAIAQAGSVAALIAEPIIGNQGGVLPPPGYTRAVVDAVHAAGGLFVADEIQVGYGRLGHHFWGFEHEGVLPDVVTIAKATGNGYPVGAVITTREIADALGRDASWFSSVGGSPVACAVGLAVLDTIESEGLQENARVVGDHLRARLEGLVERHELAGAVHGMGLYLGLELVRDRNTLEPATREAYALCERLRTLGVIVQPTGDHENVLKIKPPLVITREAADFFADQLDRVLHEGW